MITCLLLLIEAANRQDMIFFISGDLKQPVQKDNDLIPSTT
jgi:hypothetical protein